jgi:transketolase
MRRAFVAALSELAARDERVVLLTADLGFAFLEPFRDRFPSRFFNVGVAEANLVGLATGLAEDGFVPFTYTMAAFALSRAFEVVRNGPVAHRLPVRIVGVGGGFDYGANGASHYALDDLALARALGAIDILVPADAAGAKTAVLATPRLPGPIYLRLANEERGALPGPLEAFEPGRFLVLRGGARGASGACDVCIVALGPTAFDALAAADVLAAAGASVSVVVPTTLRPFDRDLLLERLAGARLVVTLENHALEGGLGSLVAEVFAEAGGARRLLRAGVATHGFPPGSPGFLRAQLGLDGPSLARRIGAALRQT